MGDTVNHPLTTLIHEESRLLDRGLLDDWLALYAADATYWVPIDETIDPLKDSSVIFDNRLRLAMRVEQIMRQNRVGQTPSSSTMRMVSNVEIAEADGDRAGASFALLIVEVRSGDWRQHGLGETRLFPGHCEMKFVRESNGWKIAHKKIVLLNRKQPIEGLSFIL